MRNFFPVFLGNKPFIAWSGQSRSILPLWALNRTLAVFLFYRGSFVFDEAAHAD